MREFSTILFILVALPACILFVALLNFGISSLLKVEDTFYERLLSPTTLISGTILWLLPVALTIFSSVSEVAEQGKDLQSNLQKIESDIKNASPLKFAPLPPPAPVARTDFSGGFIEGCKSMTTALGVGGSS